MARFAILLLCQIWIFGCGYAITTHREAGVDFSNYKTIAVAPFREFSHIDKGVVTEKAIDQITQYLKEKNYSVIESNAVQKYLELQNYSLDALTYPTFIAKLGEELETDALLMETLRIYKRKLGDIELSVDIELYDVRNGKLVWSGKYHDIQQKSYAETFSRIIGEVVEEIMDHFPAIPR
jgi:TolB-like protein